MSSRTASRSSRKNLWKTKVIEDKYETDLRRYAAAFQKYAVELLPRYVRTGDDGKPYVEMSEYAAELNRVISSQLDDVSRELMDGIEKTYLYGALLAETSVRDAQ